MMFGYGYDMGWMWLWGSLALIGVLVLIFVIVRASTGGIKRSDSSEAPPFVGLAKSTPRQILDERYAKGELTTEEYRERLTELGADS